MSRYWGSGGMADTHDLGLCALRREGSTPSFPIQLAPRSKIPLSL